MLLFYEPFFGIAADSNGNLPVIADRLFMNP